MSYKQTLIKIIKPIKKTTISRLNKGKKWKYGYNKEHDVVVISKTGRTATIKNTMWLLFLEQAK